MELCVQGEGALNETPTLVLVLRTKDNELRDSIELSTLVELRDSDLAGLEMA